MLSEYDDQFQEDMFVVFIVWWIIAIGSLIWVGPPWVTDDFPNKMVLAIVQLPVFATLGLAIMIACLAVLERIGTTIERFNRAAQKGISHDPTSH